MYGTAKKFCMPDGMPFPKAHARHAKWHAFKPHYKYIYFDWSIFIPYFPCNLFSDKIDFLPIAEICFIVKSKCFFFCFLIGGHAVNLFLEILHFRYIFFLYTTTTLCLPRFLSVPVCDLPIQNSSLFL